MLQITLALMAVALVVALIAWLLTHDDPTVDRRVYRCTTRGCIMRLRNYQESRHWHTACPSCGVQGVRVR